MGIPVQTLEIPYDMTFSEAHSEQDDPNGTPTGSHQPSTANDAFLYPRHHYHGKFTPQNLTFNANLQEFSQAVGYICALETGGKISSQEAYQQIKKLYKQLKRSKKALGIGEDGEPSQDSDD